MRFKAGGFDGVGTGPGGVGMVVTGTDGVMGMVGTATAMMGAMGSGGGYSWKGGGDVADVGEEVYLTREDTSWGTG